MPRLCFFLCFAVLAVHVSAQGYTVDDVWKQREEEAKAAADAAYEPNPDEITNDLNLRLHQAVEGKNSTRRNLGKYRGQCMATNPIDRCWRCNRNWARNRKRLADCVLGFGRKTDGGRRGNFYVVTDPSDNDLVSPAPGTLRHAATQKEPLWIIFARDMVIRLSEELLLTSDKTIDGRGARVEIAYGKGITIQFVNNVIIHGIRIHDIVSGPGGMIRDSVDHVGLRTKSDGDGISIFGSSNIWIDHVSMWNCADGLIDAVQGSTAITVSNGHFTRHNDVMLFGASDTYPRDSIMQVTIAFNHFGKGLVQRMPRCRWGFFHVVNNDYTHWIMYAIGGSNNPTIISQGNRFIAPPNPAAKEVTLRNFTPEDVWKHWIWRSEGDLMLEGAFFRQSGNPRLQRRVSGQDMIKALPGTFVGSLTRFAGVLPCRVKQPC